MRVRATLAVVTAVLAVALIWMAPQGLGAQGGAALTGTVSSAEEPKMEGIVVTARAEGANFSTSVVSDASGKYSFPRSHVKPGKYTVAIRQQGFDLAPVEPVDVMSATTATLNLRLTKIADPTRHMTSREWALSLPASPWVDRTVYNIESCVYCHSLERIVKSKHSPEQWDAVLTRMLKYYPDGTVAAGTGRGRAIFKTKEEQDAAEKSPNWWPYSPDSSGPIPKKAFSEYLSTINLSGGRSTLPFVPKTLPRSNRGKGTKVIITTWDLPRRDTVPHDSDVDSKGNLWYTDESAMFVGVLDPKTNTIREFPMPPVEKGDIPGVRDVIVDRQDNVWFAMRVAGSRSKLHKFEPQTQKLTPVEDTQGQFVALQGDPDGSHVWLGYTRVSTKTAMVNGDFRKPANLPPGKQSTGYGFAVTSKGDPYGTDFVGSNIYGVDVAKGEGTFYPTPRPNMVPRRGKMDAQDRFWFAYYGAEALGMFDTKTKKFSEWKLGPKYSTPYTATVPDAKGRVYLPSNSCDCFFRVDTKSGEVIEYAMPGAVGSFDTKKVSLDPTSKNPVLLFANTRNGQLMRVEPLD